jgi:hypothetical protein
MSLFKFVLAFFSVGMGGVTFTLIKMNKAPLWLKVVSLMMATATLIFALPELPRGFDAVRETWGKIDELLSRRSARVPTASPPSLSASDPPIRSSPTVEPANSATIAPTYGGSAKTTAEHEINAVTPVPSPADVKPLTPDDVRASTPAQSAESLFPQEQELQVERNTHLFVNAGAKYKLAAGKAYFLEAPLGYTVGYLVDDGTVTLYRDGEGRRFCIEGPFKTFARISKYSVVACSPTVILQVVYVRPGDEFSYR